MPTISRLFADYSATALRLFRAQPESRAGICAQFRGECAARPGGRSGGRSAGGLRAVLARRAAGSAGDLRGAGSNVGRISRRRGECLYLRRNRPLNARLCLRGIPICPRCKRAVYARFRGGISRRCRKPPRKTWARSTGRRFIRRLGWAVGTLRGWAVLVRLEARRSCRRSEYLQMVQPPTAGAGDTPPSRRQRKAPAGFEPIGAGVYLEFFAASMSIKNGINRI